MAAATHRSFAQRYHAADLSDSSVASSPGRTRARRPHHNVNYARRFPRHCPTCLLFDFPD